MSEVGKSIVVFAPHLDDETFNCGGTIVNKLREGFKVLVVYMTDSRGSHLIDLCVSENPTPDEVAVVRKKEVSDATAELGIPPSNLTFLNFPDGELIHHIAAARERVKALLLEAWPDEIYIPSQEDCHPDHVATNEIVLNAIETIDQKMTPITVNEYTAWTSCDVERAEVGDGVVTDRRGREVVETVRNDISGAALAAKNRAIDKYPSQISRHPSPWPLQPRAILSEEFLKPFRENTEEVFERYVLGFEE
ncbi:hypothetical protein HOF67_05030 [Candidatus Peregrinibacteria bacterium]|mgnify:FL=1|jgi:LmbE family N-acetylglucosaminyl deacetylase|nr:hypothetical protein [Candidatus Peregrinibacteria bacterium]